MERVEPTIGNLESVADAPKATEELKPKVVKPALASRGARYMAHGFDLLFAGVLGVIVIAIAQHLQLDQTVQDAFVAAVACGYYLLCDALPKGRSLGKSLYKISVISKKTGAYCTLYQSFLRNITIPFLAMIDMLLILGKSKRRIGDYLAGTVVVKAANNASH
ncbi:RDD family protein [Agarivorans sp. TSD2052]|uniref:RDD family protein n=1 Tax=Agarivorans sp. TSD2052 TaxID=2937286 RepID=UPI00200E2217|nr:RDD family protein [Agarivorans sp. TSD2052]UPW20562.1 RDD family protein [Agarivorans sp. TSD2052]